MMPDENQNPDYLEYNLLGDEEFLDDETDAWEDGAQALRPEPEVAVDELMDQLAHEEELPSHAALRALSDLSRLEAEIVAEHWPEIPVEKRRELVAGVIQDAEEDVQWQLGRILRIALADEDAQVRRMAVEGLWEDGDTDLIGIFTHLLRSDPSTEVRAAAAAALGTFVLEGELDELDASLAMRAEESLLSVLRNEEEPVAVQSQALESIAYSGEVGVRDLIEDAYYSPYEEMRVSALNAMGRSADIRWRSLVRAELTNPSALMRVSAAIACGELEAHDAVDELILLLNDEEQAVRLAAVFALGRLGGKTAQEALRELAATENEGEAEAAEDALAEMLFYGSGEDSALYDEALDLEEDDDEGPWDGRYRRDDDDLGTYE